MTKFFNLESYLECCQYASLFDKSSETLIPANHSFPLPYKNFYHEYSHREFLPIPVINSNFPSQLKPRDNYIIKHTLGFSINDDNSEQIFIIREANSLVLRVLNSRYLYSNVYRYWSYANQLENYAKSGKPIIIYDFNSFTPQQITPLTFENYPNSPYLIPIIDTRNLEKYQSLNLNLNYEDIYNNICEQFANKIIRQCKIDIRHRQETIHYVKAINIFSYINHHTVHLPLLIKVDNNYYQYNFDVNNLGAIISQNFPLEKLRDIVKNNEDQYHFVILTNYSRISSIYNALSNEFIILKTEENNFENIWQETRKKQFPLYGQHLDNISFFVRRKGEDKDMEISLPSQICYEGEKEVIVYGEYLNNQGIITNEFSMSTTTVSLPFTINQQILINDATEKEQIYQINNQYFETTPELKIKIRFRLQPGLNPKLEIIDQFDRILTSSLTDREEITLGYIPYDKICDFRQKISQRGWAKLSAITDILLEKLELWQNLLNISDIVEKARKIHQLRLDIEKYLPIILNIDNNNFEQQYIVNFYQSLDNFLENTLSQLSKKPPSNLNHNLKKIIYEGYDSMLLFLGKSYSLTQNMSLNYLFDSDKLIDKVKFTNSRIKIQTKNSIKNLGIYLQNIARMSCTLLRQKQFFNLFNLYSQKEGTKFYKLDNYLWGYARILVWYFDFNNSEQLLNYQQHFQDIITHTLTLNPSDNKNNGYLQNALITLIYLLTFRQYDVSFVIKNSTLYNQSKNLCQQLQYHPITTTQVKINMSLNEFFDKILEGKAIGIPIIEVD
ncbi:hypothetical protein [Geminocystis sp. GBBB08]|uniref:hypothetical protein n=1 Tax=Geminocystis sp. GBBB08 TaxID=2604140 RepID=UPI0027E36DDC|nr:hypothetical protein [Geminocystis sp. GBBB08]MBL1209645.1 hypothetical protein [Geminocystis sp. GBBB08]